MKRLVLLASVAISAFVWAAPAMAQTTKTFQQGKNGYTGAMDTYIDKYDAMGGNDTFVNVERIEVRDWDAGATEKKNALLMFDLSSIPTTATVTSAKLTLYNIRATGNGVSDVLILGKVTSAWNGQLSWNMGVPNTVASGVTCPPVNGYTLAPNPPEVYTITGMASLVQDWVTTPATNYGMMFSCTSDLNISFASSDYPSLGVYSQYHPELEVTYTNGPVTPPPPSPPTVTVIPPPANVDTTPVTITGTASATSPATVTKVDWSNTLTGGTGTATGTTSWSATIPLSNGFNPITITVTDSNGLTATSSVTVRYRDPAVKGKSEHKPCGFGVTGAPTGSFAVAALALALLLASGRPARAK